MRTNRNSDIALISVSKVGITLKSRRRYYVYSLVLGEIPYDKNRNYR